MKQAPVPEVGKFYHFWDDGKTSPSRHYIAKVERVIPLTDTVKLQIKYYDHTEDALIYGPLFDIWKERSYDDHLFSSKTDFIIEVSCPRYDKNLLYFARTKNGSWFSMDIQSSWQGGSLDVTGEIWDQVLKSCKEYGYDPTPYEKEKYGAS